MGIYDNVFDDLIPGGNQPTSSSASPPKAARQKGGMNGFVDPMRTQQSSNAVATSGPWNDFSHTPEKQAPGGIDFSYNSAKPINSADQDAAPVHPAALGITARVKRQNEGFLSDTLTDVKRGIQQIPSAFTELHDATYPLTYLTGHRIADEAYNWLGAKTGFQPSKWEKQAAEEYSPERQASDKAINDAWKNGSVRDMASSYLNNPRAVAGALVGNLVGGPLGLAARALSRLRTSKD